MKPLMFAAAGGALIAWAIASGAPAEAQPAFQNCDAARAAGRAPISRGQPGYGPHLDRDGDGIGCEQPGNARPPRAVPQNETSEITLPARAAAQREILDLEPGEAQAIATERGVRTVVVGDPEVASANVISDQLVIITTKPNASGRTNLILFDENAQEILRRTILIRSMSPPPPPQLPQTVIKISGGAEPGVQEMACLPFCIYKPALVPPVVVQSTGSGSATPSINVGAGQPQSRPEGR